MLQIDLRDLQIHSDVQDGFVLGVDEALSLGLIAGAKALAFVNVGVEAVEHIPAAAINETITFHAVCSVVKHESSALEPCGRILTDA